MKYTLVMILATSMIGCTSVVERGATANDVAVTTSIDGLCRIYSVGAIKRRFNTPELASLYQELCREESNWSPVQ